MLVERVTPVILREANGLSLRDVAEALEVSLLDYRKMEKRPSDIKVVDYVMLCELYRLNNEDRKSLLNTILTDGLDIVDDDLLEIEA